VEGILDRLGLVRRVKLSPEQGGARDLKRLARAYLARGAPCLVLMLHSSSLLPGMSPYVAGNQELERFYLRLEATFHHLTGASGHRSVLLTEMYHIWAAGMSSPS